MQRFRFPIVIIDEDYRSENTSGLGIRALAQAIEAEGFEVLGVTSYGDLSQFAQQQSRASAFILSIDDEEFKGGPELDPAVKKVRDNYTRLIGILSSQVKDQQQLNDAVVKAQYGKAHVSAFSWSKANASGIAIRFLPPDRRTKTAE